MKKIITLLLWLGGSVAYGQTIQNQSFGYLSQDGTKIQNSSYYSLPQVQGTPLMQATATITPQVSNWFQLNGQQGAQMEFQAIGYLGTYQVQVSDNISSSATPIPPYYTIVQDAAIVATPGPGAQTLNWSYFVKNGWKYLRVIANPSTSNTGTLNVNMRTFGSDVQRGNLQEGVPWQGSAVLIPSANYATPGGGFAEFKLPYMAHGVELIQNITAITIAATPSLTGTLYTKDPQSGVIMAVGTPVKSITTSTTVYEWTAGASGTASANINYFTFPANQDIVFQWVGAGTSLATLTFSVTAIPLF